MTRYPILGVVGRAHGVTESALTGQQHHELGHGILCPWDGIEE